MTDDTNNRAAAEGELLNAIGYVHDADLSKADRAYQCINFALIHALLAIHDTLADLKPEPATYQPSTLPVVDAADRYAANEAKQREVEPETPGAAEWLSLDEDDPLDEDDHRDRLDRDGDVIRRKGNKRWAWPDYFGFDAAAGSPLTALNASDGPLTFAPEPPPDGAGDDLTASEGESGSVDGEAADDAQKAILRPEPLWCPECGHHIDDHHDGSCLTLCECIALPSQIAQALITDAVKAERTRMTAQLRQVVSSAQDSGDLAELDALADEWEAGNDG